MADDKRGRDKQAHDAEKRQRKRYMAADLERGDEPEPPLELDDLEADLETVSFPAPATDVVEAVGTHEVESSEGTYSIADLLPATDAETFAAPRDVRVRVEKPTIATAMKRIAEAADALPREDFDESQREAYEKTLQELKDVEADDEDEGIEVVSDWIVEQIQDKEKLPGSRAVRRRAAEFCRANGHEISNDEWLGV